MDQDTNIIQRNTIGKLNSYGEFFECKLCNMEIIGSNQLKKHLAGKRHNRNKVKDNGNINISICNSVSEEELVEAQVGLIEKSMKSCNVSGSDIAVPTKLWLQRDCASCMEKMNFSIELLCGYEQFEHSINYRFSDKSLLLEAMTHGSSSSNKLTEDYQTLEFLGDFALNFHISRQLEKQSRDIAITPGDMSQRRSILISNIILAWIAIRNNFHQYFRMECPSAKSEVDRFINLVDETEPKIQMPRENDKEEK